MEKSNCTDKQPVELPFTVHDHLLGTNVVITHFRDVIESETMKTRYYYNCCNASRPVKSEFIITLPGLRQDQGKGHNDTNSVETKSIALIAAESA